MSDRDDIRSLIYEYAYRFDQGDIEGWAKLFEHGKFVSSFDGVPRSAKEIYDSTSAHTIIYEDGTPRTAHSVSNVQIDVDPSGTSASARSYVTVIQQAPDHALQVLCSGMYTDTFHRVAEEWQFLERRSNIRLIGDMSLHQRPRN